MLRGTQITNTHPGGWKSKPFSPGTDFVGLIFTGELSGMDPAGVPRQGGILVFWYRRKKFSRKSFIRLKESLETVAVARRFSAKKVFLKTSQNSQENTSARVSFLIKLQTSGLFCELCKISKKIFFYRIPPVAFSGEISHLWIGILHRNH